MDKPDLDYIEDLSPAISIEQKTTHRNLNRYVPVRPPHRLKPPETFLPFYRVIPLLCLRQSGVRWFFPVEPHKVECAQHHPLRRHRQTTIDIHSRHFVPDAAVPFHLFLAVVVNRGGVLYRKNQWVPFHTPDCCGPVRSQHLILVELFVAEQIVDSLDL